MAKAAAPRKLLPSVLDRLLDNAPGTSSEAVGDRGWSVAQAKAAVKRDLEWLLNSRRVVATLPPGPGHLGRSALTYGLPDLAAFGLANPADQARLRRAIEETVERFEPRLTRVAVVLETGRDLERSVRFRIDAMLRVEPEPEPVSFDSVLQLDTQAFVIRDDSA
jgi:type VI secretion system protein ImpF